MSDPDVVEAAKDAIMTVVVGTVVSIAVSLFQARTQIQEPTLASCPRSSRSSSRSSSPYHFVAETSNRQFLRMASLMATRSSGERCARGPVKPSVL